MQQLHNEEPEGQVNFKSADAFIYMQFINALYNCLESLAIQYNFLNHLIDDIKQELQKEQENYIDELAFLFDSAEPGFVDDKPCYYEYPELYVMPRQWARSPKLKYVNKHKQKLDPEVFFFIRCFYLLVTEPDKETIIQAKLDIDMAEEIAPCNPYIQLLKFLSADEIYRQQALLKLLNGYTCHPKMYPPDLEKPIRLIQALHKVYYNNIIDINEAVKNLLSLIPKNEISLSLLLYDIMDKYENDGLLEITDICIKYNDREETLKAIKAVILIQGYQPEEGIEIMESVSIYDLPVSLDYQLFFFRYLIFAYLLTNEHDKAFTLSLDVIKDEDIEGIISEHYFEIGLMLAQLYVKRKYFNDCVRYLCCKNNLMFDYHKDNNPHLLYKILGDAWSGLYNYDLAVKYYKKALGVKYDDEIYRQMMRISDGV